MSLVLLVAGNVLASDAAVAAPAWTAPVPISTPIENALHPHVAFDAAGNTFATWLESQGSDYVVMSAVRSGRGGAWTAPAQLSQSGNGLMEQSLAADPTGDAIAVWTRGDYATGLIEAAFRSSSSGQWGLAETVAPPSPPTWHPTVAMNRYGIAAAAWRAGGTARAAFRGPAGWSPPVTISGGEVVGDGPSIAIDAYSNAVAVWCAGDGSVRAAYRPVAGGWQTPKALARPAVDCRNPSVAVDGAGNATAIWDHFSSSYEVQSASRNVDGGDWSATVLLATGGEGSPAPEIAVASNGAAVAAWSDYTDQTGYLVRATMKSARGPWQQPQTISQKHGFVPQVAIADMGSALAIWQRTAGQSLPYRIEGSSRRSSTGTWSSPIQLSAEDSESFVQPDLAMDPSGNGAAAWKRGPRQIEVAGYDGAGPVFADLVVPKRGQVGQRLVFTVSPYDVWSAFAGPPSWVFGDGASATGTRVIHAYSEPGTFTVGLGQADALGNTSSLTRTLEIRPASNR